MGWSSSRALDSGSTPSPRPRVRVRGGRPSAPAGTTVGGAAAALATTVPGQNAKVTFDAAAGQQVTVRLTNSTLGVVTVKLLTTDGSTQTTYTSFGSSSFNLATQTLPVAGTYTVSIDPSGAATGGISVGVTSP